MYTANPHHSCNCLPTNSKGACVRQVRGCPLYLSVRSGKRTPPNFLILTSCIQTEVGHFHLLAMSFAQFSICFSFPYWLLRTHLSYTLKVFFLVYLPLDFRILHFYIANFLKNFPFVTPMFSVILSPIQEYKFKIILLMFSSVSLWFPFYI